MTDELAGKEYAKWFDENFTGFNSYRSPDTLEAFIAGWNALLKLTSAPLGKEEDG